jgi:uncharacterized membrane protein YgdD (TMEM256/DUF423 family)
MSGTGWLRVGATLGALGVTAGAFGAHGLEGTLTERYQQIYETAVRYQMYHALALLAVGLVGTFGKPSRGVAIAGWSFLLGTLVFSGTLYALALTQVRWLGMITPIGGLGLIAGWVALAVAGVGAGKVVEEPA